MTNLNPLILDYDWYCFPPADFDPALGLEPDPSNWGMVDVVANWPGHLLPSVEAVYLSRVFSVEPINDVCVRFWLYVEAAPEGTAITINGWYAGTTQNGQGLVADATDYIMLDGNQILITLNQPGFLQGIYLRPVPCEET